MKETVVSVKDLTFRYKNSPNPALTGINLEVHKGEFITITGRSGCGKSTLALCLAGFIPHYVPGDMQGSVAINKINTRDCSPVTLAGSIGLVQQDPETQLCTLRVVDEVAFGPENLGVERGEIRERVEWALQVVKAAHLREREVYSLSGGEKQRIAIASILAMQPSLIILDEPTANLDPDGSAEIIQVIEGLRKQLDTSVIVIEHRIKNLLAVSDRMLIMRQGSIIADGKAEQVYREYRSTNAKIVSADECRRQVDNEPPGESQTAQEQLPKPVLKGGGLCSRYGHKTVLREVGFEAYAGEIIAVMGSNGSGKTSFLLSLLGIHSLEQGRLYLHEREITADKVALRARHMGLVFQNPNHQIFENTVYQEAALPASMLLPDTEREHADIDGWLDRFNLLEYRERLPFALSLGEKKRLTLVSVLGYRPEILLLDEPLIGQDDHHLDVFWKAVWQHSHDGGTTIMVCHDPDFVQQFCHRLLFFHNGEIIVNNFTAQAFKQLEEMGITAYLPNRYRD